VHVAGGDLRYQFRTGGEHVDVHILGWIGLAAIILTLIAIDIVGHLTHDALVPWGL